MDEKKRTELKVIQFKKKKEEKRSGGYPMSDDEVSLNIKIDDLEHLFNIGETIVMEINELEKNVGNGKNSEAFARFLANWDATIGVFSDYYENS